MRKTVFKQVFLLLLLAGIVFACMEKDDLFPAGNLPPEISEAKTWYESRVNEGRLPWIPANGGKTNVLTPDWERAFSNENENSRVTEIHLEGKEKFIMVSSECAEKYDETGNDRYLTSDIRLVIRTDKTTGRKDGFIMVICPDLSYLEVRKDHPLKDISYLKRGATFSGVIYYHDMNGEFVNGWKYKDGTVRYAFHSETALPDQNQFRGNGEVYWCQYTEFVTDWYVNGHYIGSTPGGNSTECYIMYWYDTGSDGGYGAGGGSGNSNGGDGSPSAQLSALASKVSLSSTQTELLNDVLDDVLQDCGFQFMNGSIVTSEYKFSDVKIDPSISSSGGYDPFTGNLLFRGTNDINKDIFREELVHLYQTSYYGQSQMKNYFNTASGNIEFEAKLIEDLLCNAKPVGGCMYFGEGLNYGSNYANWITSLTSDGTRFPTMQDIMNTKETGLGYWDFLTDFVQKSGAYYNLSVNYSLTPGALNFINSTVVTNCITQKNK